VVSGHIRQRRLQSLVISSCIAAGSPGAEGLALASNVTKEPDDNDAILAGAASRGHNHPARGTENYVSAFPDLGHPKGGYIEVDWASDRR